MFPFESVAMLLLFVPMVQLLFRYVVAGMVWFVRMLDRSRRSAIESSAK
jgi:hypothetical protein